MNSRVIGLIIGAIIGIPMLILIGQWSATEPMLAGISAGVVVGLLILFQLGSRCWLLIPFFSTFTGSLVILPGDFAPRDVVVGLVVPMLLLIWVVRRFPVRLHFGAIEVSLFIILLFVAQAFIRNPAGLSVLGGDQVGARPYFEIAISVFAYIVLSIQVTSLRDVRAMIIALFVGAILVGIWESVTGLIPSLAFATAGIYRGETTTLAAKQFMGLSPSNGETSGRLIFLKHFPQPLTNLVGAYKSPLQLLNLRNFLWATLIAIALICVLLSGFRSGVAGVGLMMMAAAILYGRSFEIFVIGMIGVPLLAVLLVMQGTVFDLPLPAQRALSFLPADWDNRAVVEAEGSSEWRFEMWREALSSDRYIRNKWLGDGFGFSADEMAYQQNLQMRGVRPEEMQDFFLITGAYHSGPVETIKRIGYLGLVFMLGTMFVFVGQAVKLVKRSRNTPHHPYAIFLAIPILVLPVEFIFVFGSFNAAVSQLLLAGGMFRLLGNSLESESLRATRQSVPVAASRKPTLTASS